MDHNLEDSLNMEGIENMDFDHSGVVVNQEDIALEERGQASDMPMDLDAIEEQTTLLNAGNEEVIVSDFIGDQFGFQEYSVQGENSSGANITIDANQLNELKAQTEQVMDLQFADCITKPSTSQPSVITIKAIPQQRSAKKTQTAATFPRQVAIAPKPFKVGPNVQYALAPKPVALVVNKHTGTLPKSVPMKSVVQNIKGNTVLAQIGKQIVMMPASTSGQKIKLTSILPSVSSDSNIQFVRQLGSDSAQLISNKGGKPMRTKFIVQAPAGADPALPALIGKVPGAGAAQARYVMQQKTVPISIGNKVVLTTSPKPGVKTITKKHSIISIKQQSPQVGISQGNMQTKKVVITANPNPTKNLIVKAAGGTVSAVKKVEASNTQGQRTQLHPINVPGKGIQFIKLVTNQPTAAHKPALKGSTVAMSRNNFVLTDSKGNIIQMTSEKGISSQPPPLLVTTSATTSANVGPKQKKLVRLAPISHTSETPPAKVREASKMAYCLQPKQSRSAQSLLISQKTKTVLSGTSVSLEEFNEMVDQNNMNYGAVAGATGGDSAHGDSDDGAEVEGPADHTDVKPTLASLISDAVAGEENVHEISNMEEVEIEYENTPQKQERLIEDENTMDHETGSERQDESNITASSNFQNNNTREHDEDMYQDDTNMTMDDSSNKMHTVLNVEADVMPYLSPQQSYSDSMFMFDAKLDTHPALRPRKACNCTKSQCLKLYCDCFANGEFCNKCNCNNCHNNLENEELRQKAIRACLERNPNAFRPKIGKAKSGGPDIVRRHNKGCNCKRSGCLKNYCECYEAKIACTLMCKCVGCRNIEETLERRRDAIRLRDKLTDPAYRAPLPLGQMKYDRQPCSFMTPEVISAVAQCMLATVAERGAEAGGDAVEDILLEFSRCMADIISASHQAL